MILGAVLAGGQSRRFGSDKAEAIWNGKTLIDHAVAGLAVVAAKVIVCGRNRLDVASITDQPQAGFGPLGGLNAALHHAETFGYARVITVPCDTPLLPPILLATLAAEQGDGFVRGMPVIGIWHANHARALGRYLFAADDRSMRGWARSIGARALDLTPPVNINRPADLAKLDEK